MIKKISDVYNIGDLIINSISLKEVIEYIKVNKNKVNGYICVTNTRTAYLANKNTSYCTIQNNSLLTIPDGMPLVWLGKLSGNKKLTRIAGPELFQKIMSDSNSNIKHFLLGDTPEVLNKLTEKCKNVLNSSIVGSYSPPFKSVNLYDYKLIAEEINESQADVVWLALGSPKQDVFASKLMEYTNHKIIINVGAAFRFLLGEYNMPSMTIQKIGMTGVYWRFKQKPKLFLTEYPKYFLFILKHSVIKILFKK